MRAFLLAGGEGRRLRPLTARIPKCLVPIRGTPLLALWLDILERQGVSEILVNVSQHAEQVEALLAARGERPLRVHLVRERVPAGNAGTVAAHRSFVEGEESFWVIYSDNLTNMALAPMLAYHRRRAGPLTMALFKTPSPRESGIVSVDGSGRVVGFEEKPEQPAGNLANAGIYLARQALFDAIPAGRAVTDFGHDVLPQLVGRMYAYEVDGFFADVGTPERLARAEAAWPGLQG